jgi:hypothetical protein
MMQSPRDWYRRTTWTPADEQDFFGRLRRARNKPEYLREPPGDPAAGEV